MFGRGRGPTDILGSGRGPSSVVHGWHAVWSDCECAVGGTQDDGESDPSAVRTAGGRSLRLRYVGPPHFLRHPIYVPIYYLLCVVDNFVSVVGTGTFFGPNGKARRSKSYCIVICNNTYFNIHCIAIADSAIPLHT